MGLIHICIKTDIIQVSKRRDDDYLYIIHRTMQLASRKTGIRLIVLCLTEILMLARNSYKTL